MAGLISDDKNFGTHLNSKGETIDKELWVWKINPCRNMVLIAN